MQGVILDMELRFIRDVAGEFDTGMFKWTDGALPVLGWFGVKKSTPVDFTERVPCRDKSACVLMFDGKDYKQLKINDLKDNDIFKNMTYAQLIEHFKIGKLTLSAGIDSGKAYADFINYFKIGHYIKKAMISQPKDSLKTILEFLAFVTMFASIFCNWYLVNSSRNTTKPIILAVNKSTAIQAATTQVLLNQSRQQQQEITLLTNYLMNRSRSTVP